MKWYKKQLDAMSKQAAKGVATGSTAYSNIAGVQKKSQKSRSHNPVSQRNSNRSKTDSKPPGK